MADTINLRSQQKRERREHILAAAREIIAERGYAALTMRDLARAARVTVPTIYNLIGSKEEVLFAAVEEQTADFLAGIAEAPRSSPSAAAISVVERCVKELLRLPAYYQSLLRLLATSEAARDMRRLVSVAMVGEFERALVATRDGGGLADWVDTRAVAERLGAHTSSTSLQWASGELNDEGLLSTSLYGCVLVLLGATTGETRAALESRVEEDQRRVQRHRPPDESSGSTRTSHPSSSTSHTQREGRGGTNRS